MKIRYNPIMLIMTTIFVLLNVYVFGMFLLWMIDLIGMWNIIISIFIVIIMMLLYFLKEYYDIKLLENKRCEDE